MSNHAPVPDSSFVGKSILKNGDQSSRSNASVGAGRSPPGERSSRSSFRTPGALGRALTTSLNPLSSRSHHQERRCTEEFVQQHSHILEQLKKNRHCVVNPRTSRWVIYWDGCTFLCLIFTAVVTPIEVCLFLDTSMSIGTSYVALFIANRVVDAFFLLDLILNFFLAYQESAQDGGRWVTNPKRIRSHYLRSWFLIDAFSMLPFELLSQLGVFEGGLLRLVRTIRLLRLIKLVRILRGARRYPLHSSNAHPTRDEHPPTFSAFA